MKLGAMKTERDLHVMKDERHKIEMIKVDTKDAIRRAERMEMACSHAIASWTNRVNVMQRQVAQMQQVTNSQIQSQLIDRLMAQLADKNSYLTDLTN